MCRLLAVLSDHPRTIPETVENVDQFTALSSFHTDGWGVADIPADADATVRKGSPPARHSDAFADLLTGQAFAAALVHLRLASAGLPGDTCNNHPFVNGPNAFAHNGTIREPGSFAAYIPDALRSTAVGTTDSEQYFFLLLTMIGNYGLLDGAKRTIETIRCSTSYTSLNSILVSASHVLAVCDYDPADTSENTSPDFFELRYRRGSDDLVIASSGWNLADPEPIGNRHLLIADRATRHVTIHPID